MRPIRVEFQAFGPYAGHETVDFDSLSSKGLFLICGKTGTGKTTILDAMTFALYGMSSGHGRDDFESMRCTNAEFADTTFVRFEFENNGDRYRFERRLERKVKRLSPSYDLSKMDDEGVYRSVIENCKDRELTARATEIIGLDYEQFRQVIILPQGQFEKLLTSDSNEKEKILTKIFGEAKWQKIAEKFYDKAAAAKAELEDVRKHISVSLEDEGCKTTEELRDLLTTMRKSDEELREEFKKSDYDKTIKEQQENLVLVKRFSDLAKAENKVADFENRKDERESWQSQAADAERAEKVRPLLDEEDKKYKSYAERQRAEKAATSICEEKKKAAEQADLALKDHLAGEKDIEECRKKQIEYEGKREDYKALDEAEAAVTQAKAAVATAKKEEENARALQETDEGELVAVKQEFEDARHNYEMLLNSYLAGITGELADKLEDGKPCPVCGSTTHPHKAAHSDESASKEQVDKAKKNEDKIFAQLSKLSERQEKDKSLTDEKHAAYEKANAALTSAAAVLEGIKKNLAEGIETSADLEDEIEKLMDTISGYVRKTEKLTEEKQSAAQAYTAALANIETAKAETKKAGSEYEDIKNKAGKGLSENGFDCAESAKELMMSPDELADLRKKITSFDEGLKAAKSALSEIKKELKGKAEPDEEECRSLLEQADKAKNEYSGKKAVLEKNIERLDKKLKNIESEGEGLDERIRIAEDDFTFAKRLRGDSGTGLQRYVLGIMFSSVIAAANKMLEMVHGGRYRLFRTDDKAQGSNKRGLDLKVFDKNSEEHEGRFVSTLSGGEKFLVSLALSIGMSTVAQKSGIRIEALFIDEGFGSLDDDSIADAMSVLNSIREANGLVGIISHVQILQDQIPSKLRIVPDSKGSHIVESIG